nr:hypothetical protein BaRGS_019293 [Batillaria attramentaria]
MEKRALPGTDLKVSPLCLGTWQFNDAKANINWEGQTKEIHFPSFVKDAQETINELNSQIARGRIRYYGCSNFGPKNLKAYLEAGLLTGKYMKPEDVPEGRRRGKLFDDNKNKLARHGQQGAETEMFEALQKIKGICDANKLDMTQAALSWVLQQEGVPVAIVGASTPEQIAKNSQIVQLSPEVVKQLTDATEPVKQKIGRQLDQWVTPDRCE